MILAATLRDPGRPATSTASAQCSPAFSSRRATRLRRGLAALPGGSLLLRRPIVTHRSPALSICSAEKKNSADQLVEAEAARPLGFSVLSHEVPWDSNDTWTIFAAYFFILHIPLSFGGLSVVAEIIHEPNLDPLTVALCSIALQTTEYIGALTLFNHNVKPQHKWFIFFYRNWSAGERSWIAASIFGIGLLAGVVLFTSVIADSIIGPKDVNNPVLKEILLSSSFSRTTCFMQYCIITPLLEETVYRGFLLSSLGSTANWLQAVVISSFVFSVGHFSGENFLQLFLIGSILGSAYCWTGSLRSCFVIHSVYNATILLLTMISKLFKFVFVIHSASILHLNIGLTANGAAIVLVHFGTPLVWAIFITLENSKHQMT